MHQYEYIYSDKERIYLLLLMLLCHDEELSTYHFMDELEISKNTLLLDLKKLHGCVSINQEISAEEIRIQVMSLLHPPVSTGSC